MTDRIAIRTSSGPALLVLSFLFLSQVFAFGQTTRHSTQAAAAQSSGQNARNQSEARSTETASVLVQLNTALEDLAAKVSPAVVQILVTGYGTAREQERSQTAFIVR